jgi:mono/diheme cytochrome c family protein
MLHLSELHGAATHLAVVAIPLYFVLLLLRRLGRGGDAVRAWEPWVLAAAVLGVALSGLTGLLVRGQSQTELRGADYGIGGIHFWLGIAIAAVLLAAIGDHLRRRGRLVPVGSAALALTFAAAIAVLAQGYLGGRMTYEQGVGVAALGQGRQTAVGAARLATDLTSGMADVQAGRRAFSVQGLGCATCHGDLAQGQRGPRLSGGRDVEDFRRVHGAGLFPPSVVTDRDFDAIDAYLRSLRRPG